METNEKILYEHYVKTGQKERAEIILKVYPQFKGEKSKKDK